MVEQREGRYVSSIDTNVKPLGSTHGSRVGKRGVVVEQREGRYVSSIVTNVEPLGSAHGSRGGKRHGGAEGRVITVCVASLKFCGVCLSLRIFPGGVMDYQLFNSIWL